MCSRASTLAGHDTRLMKLTLTCMVHYDDVLLLITGPNALKRTKEALPSKPTIHFIAMPLVRDGWTIEFHKQKRHLMLSKCLAVAAASSSSARRTALAASVSLDQLFDTSSS